MLQLTDMAWHVAGVLAWRTRLMIFRFLFFCSPETADECRGCRRHGVGWRQSFTYIQQGQRAWDDGPRPYPAASGGIFAFEHNRSYIGTFLFLLRDGVQNRTFGRMWPSPVQAFVYMQLATGNWQLTKSYISQISRVFTHHCSLLANTRP